MPPSDPANELLIEGESLVPTATGTIAISQVNTGNLVWSGDRQLRVNAAELFDATTLTFQVPRSGSYVMSADMTQGQNFGVAQIALDGAVIAQFDGRPGPPATSCSVDSPGVSTRWRRALIPSP